MACHDKILSSINKPLPVLNVSQFAGVFPFGSRGEKIAILIFWCFLVSCSVGPSSFAFNSWQIEQASSSLSPSKRKEQIYTSLELFKSMLFSSSLLLHIYVSTKYRSLFTNIIGILSKMSTPNVGGRDLILGTLMAAVRCFCLGYALLLANNKVDVYVLRSNSIANLLSWLNFLVIFQMISLIRKLELHYTIWKHSSKNYSLHIHHHSLIIDYTQRVVSLYGRQLFLIMCQCVYAATTSCYYLVTNIFFNQEEVLLVYHIIDVLSFLKSAYQIFVVNSTCESMRSKVDAFYKELFRLMRESKTLCSNKKLCLYVSMRKTVNFTACGFFSLGYPLITSIIAAATTYLVILVQFSIPKT